jgi:hypothetical protein
MGVDCIPEYICGYLILLASKDMQLTKYNQVY